jgi:protein-tyrosine phosphatase
MASFRILTVCTGNICRSPQAEQFLRTSFIDAHSVNSRWDLPRVTSAGTHGLEGATMPEEAAALSRSMGGDPSVHRSRLLTSDLINESDLIIAMSREHRAAVARLVPSASRFTFTLKELSRALVGSVPRILADSGAVPSPGDFLGWTAVAARNRGIFGATPAEDNIEDPYRRSTAAYERSALEIRSAVDRCVTVLVGR